MKVLHIAPRYFPCIGGAETYVRSVSEYLAAADHAVTVLTTTAKEQEALYDSNLQHGEPGSESMAGLTVVRCPPNFGNQKPAASRPDFCSTAMEAYVESLQPGQFALVNGFCAPFARLLALARRAADRIRCPLVLTPFLHSHPLLARHFQTRSIQDSLSAADCIICLTRHEAEFLCGTWGISRERVHVIGAGVDPLPDTRRACLEKSAADSPFRLLFLGTQDRLKGAESVVRLSRRFSGERVIITLAGGRTESFERFISSLQRSAIAKIELRGFISEAEKSRLFEAMHCLLLPSIAESFGLVYLESWQRGKPVIGANYGAAACLIAHDSDGLLVDFDDIDAMELAVRRYVNNPALRKQHGKAGRLKAANYHWPVVITRLASLYSTLAG